MIVVLFVVTKLNEHRKKVKEKNFVSQMSLWVLWNVCRIQRWLYNP